MTGRIGMFWAVLALVAGTSAPAAASLPQLQLQTFHVCPAVDPMSPPTDLTGCAERAAHQIRPSDEARWLVATFDVPRRLLEADVPLGLFVSGLFSAQAYLNDVPVGGKGRPGTLGREIAGPIDVVLPVHPDAISGHDNRLALLISTQALDAPVRRPIHGVRLGEYGPATEGRWRVYLPALMSVGAIVVAAAYFFAQGLFGSGRSSHLLLGAMCVAVLVMLGAETYRAFVSYPYDLHVWRMLILLGGAFLFGLLLLIYVSRRPPPHGYMPTLFAGALAVPAALLAPLYDAKIIAVLLIFLLTAFALSFRQLFKKKDDAFLLVAGLGLILVAIAFDVDTFLDRSVYLSFGVLLTALMFMEVRSHRRAVERRHKAELVSVRLEGELSKRQLQPHFLMNTLTSLIEWVEQKPRAAARMIDKLSEEYRLLLALQPRALIRVSEELELCRAHLEVMRYRTDRVFEIRTVNVDPAATIPPGIFHTLIENAFSHGGWKSGSVFTLEESRERGRRYRFTAPGGTPPSQQHDARLREGAGLSYIRARLSELYGDDWRLTSRPGESGMWETCIEIP